MHDVSRTVRLNNQATINSFDLDKALYCLTLISSGLTLDQAIEKTLQAKGKYQ